MGDGPPDGTERLRRLLLAALLCGTLAACIEPDTGAPATGPQQTAETARLQRRIDSLEAIVERVEQGPDSLRGQTPAASEGGPPPSGTSPAGGAASSRQEPTAPAAAFDADAYWQGLRERVPAIIHIQRVYTSPPNSANGVDLHVDWINTSDRVVKYATFHVTAYNAVEDAVRCEIRNDVGFRGRETGPLEPGEASNTDHYWRNAWYNSTITHAQIHRIRIEYMDGGVVELLGDEVRVAME